MRALIKKTSSGARGGFTVLEMGLSVSVMGVVAWMLVSASQAGSSMMEMGNLKAEMFRRSQVAVAQILDDLSRTGYVSLGGRDYPHVFDGGLPDVGFDEYEYEPGPMAARAGEPDFGVMRSIVFCLPSDLDGDGRPEIDANGDGVPELDGDGDGTPSDEGQDIAGLWDPGDVVIHPDSRLSWNSESVAYIVTATGPEGDNELVRVTGGAAGEREVLARGIERIQFDTPESSGFTIPNNTIRVQLFFRLTGSNGTVYRSRYELRVGTQTS